MHASTSPAASPAADDAPAPAAADELAEQLLALWRAVIAPRGVASYAIFEELDLTLTQVKALTAVSAVELTVKDLAQRLGLSLPGASRAVDALVERGLLARREDPSDRRMKRLRCTDAGHAALQRLDEARLAGVAQFTAALPAAQRKRLSGALRPILDDLAQPGREQA
jgi:DNA-binding MarR family transcriptional regulator